MMSVPLVPRRLWECPNCTHVHVTTEARAHTVMHPCSGLAGLTAPMVPAGTRCKIVAHEREDYVNGDLVTVDGHGRPVMNVTTTRDDGEDVAVFAPCATASAREIG